MGKDSNVYNKIKNALEDIYYEYLEDSAEWVAGKTKKGIDIVYNGVAFTEEKKNELINYLSENEFIYLNMSRSIQPSNNSCGANAACSIIRYYDIDVDYEKICKILKIDRNGSASETALYKLFRDNGLSVSKRDEAGINTIKESINKYEAPMLTTINKGNHWIIVYGYSNDRILVLDSLPNRFSVSMDKNEFFKSWDKWGSIIYKKMEKNRTKNK